jgi:hypothetical protein
MQGFNLVKEKFYYDVTLIKAYYLALIKINIFRLFDNQLNLDFLFQFLL